MFLFKQRLIFGLLKKIVSAIFTALYKIITLLNLQYCLLVSLVGLILFLTGVFNSSQIIKTIFIFLFIISLLLAFILTLFKLLGLFKKDKKENNVKIERVDNVVNNVEDIRDSYQGQVNEEYNRNSRQEIIEKPYPRYYTVKQNRDMIFIEYEDRYELFKREVDGKYKKIRTDYKDNIKR